MRRGGRGRGGRQLQLALSFAFTFSGAIVMGYVVGGWLDRLWQTAPWLTAAGILLGAASAMTSFMRQWQRMSKNSTRKED